MKPRGLYLMCCAALLATACETLPVAPAPGAAGKPAAMGGAAHPSASSWGVLNNITSALSRATGNAPHSALGDGVQDVIKGSTALFRDDSAEAQRRLGVDFASVLLGARPLLRDDAVQRYVNQVGGWVAAQAERPKGRDGKEISFAWRFGVINADAVNAYATPGGFVFVTVGLMRRLNSEAELAGVLGHEIAHVMRGHYLAAIRKGGFTQIAGGIVQARSDNPAVSAAVVNAVRNIYAKGLDQSDEFDADRQGLLYAARAGYAPAGLPLVLKMYAAQGSSRDANFQLLFSTHPAPAERSARLEPLLRAKFASGSHVTNDARYAAIKRLLK